MAIGLMRVSLRGIAPGRLRLRCRLCDSDGFDGSYRFVCAYLCSAAICLCSLVLCIVSSLPHLQIFLAPLDTGAIGMQMSMFSSLLPRRQGGVDMGLRLPRKLCCNNLNGTSWVTMRATTFAGILFQGILCGIQGSVCLPGSLRLMLMP